MAGVGDGPDEEGLWQDGGSSEWAMPDQGRCEGRPQLAASRDPTYV